MTPAARDLIAEADALHHFLQTLDAADWQRPTPFMDWTPWDVVAHLHFFDEVSLLALEGRETFETRANSIMSQVMAGVSGTEQTRKELDHLDAPALLARWIETCHRLANALGELPPKHRLPWFGPDMSANSFISARFMETWAHGQDVYDLMRAPREHSDRIKLVADLGVKTFGWTFVNRKLEVPGEPPYVRLTAPSGAVWEWHEASEGNCITGPALAFCQVVTQGRNIADTNLAVTGDTAHQWMAIAQCFAGPPADPPRPGERAWE